LSVLALAASADGMLLATTPSWLGEWGNALLKIDPVRGSVEGSTFAGSEPTRLVVSGDGRFAYTYLAGEVRVCRINLASGVRDLRFAADPDGGERQHFVWDLASPPG